MISMDSVQRIAKGTTLHGVNSCHALLMFLLLFIFIIKSPWILTISIK